jgi:hypothetical protein
MPKKERPYSMSKNYHVAPSLMIPMLILLILSLSHTVIADVGIPLNQQLQYKVSRTNLSGNDTELMNQLKEQTYWINVTVTTISGDQLTLSALNYNATNVSSNSTILLNCATGESTPEGAQRLFVPPSLNAGDNIRLEYPTNQTFTLNDTFITNYLGTPLETNLLSYDEIRNNTNYATVTANVTTHWEFYWDRTTGVLVEFNYTSNTSRTTGNGDSLVLAQNIDFRIISTTPLIPEFTPPTILLLVATATTISIACTLRTSSRSQQTRKEPNLHSRALCALLFKFSSSTNVGRRLLSMEA